MTRPLNQYFINSSRNTMKFYNIDPQQITQDTEHIILQTILDKGIRYIELDLWVW